MGLGLGLGLGLEAPPARVGVAVHDDALDLGDDAVVAVRHVGCAHLGDAHLVRVRVRVGVRVRVRVRIRVWVRVRVRFRVRVRVRVRIRVRVGWAMATATASPLVVISTTSSPISMPLAKRSSPGSISLAPGEGQG